MSLILIDKLQQYKFQLAVVLLIFEIFGIQKDLLAQEDPNVISFSIPVNVDTAPVYAGPGINYYQTSTLPRGTVVEAFLRNADGWCAVRPPEGSYSWINAKFVQKTSDNVGKIQSNSMDKEVPVRVGGPSIMKSSVIQVGLTNGKLVKILGEMSLPGGTNWYKISPPPGEFRWIHERSLLQDENIAKLPAQLMLARQNFSSVNSENSSAYPDGKTPAGSDPLTLSKSPNLNRSPLTGYQSSGSGKGSVAVSDRNVIENFYQELSKLNSEFISAISKNAPDNIYQDLSDRSAFLFQKASDDEQRTAVKLLYDNIETQRKMGSSYSGAGAISQFGNNAGLNNFENNTSAFNNPDRGSSDLDQVKFQINSGTNRQNSGSNGNIDDRGNRMEFAFSSKNTNNFGNIFRRSSGKDNSVQNNAGSGPRPSSASVRSAASRRNANRSFWGTVGPNLVPPPNYEPVNNSADSISPTTGTRVSPPVPELSDSLFSQVSQKLHEDQKNHLALNSNGKIRQVGAEMTAKNQNSDSGTKWRIPGTNRFVSGNGSEIKPDTSAKVSFGNTNSSNSKLEQNQTAAPSNGKAFDMTSNFSGRVGNGFNNSSNSGSTVFSKTSLENRISVNKQYQPQRAILSETSNQIVEEAIHNNTFDAVGRLGYFPNPPDGCPPYVLVRENNGKQNIICYLETESGKNLDRFVGQTIGIRGKKGIIRRGNEAKPFYSAQSVFSIK